MRTVTYYQNANIDGIAYYYLTYDEFASLVIEDLLKQRNLDPWK